MPQRNPDARCGNCPYFKDGGKILRHGENSACLRFPRQVFYDPNLYSEHQDGGSAEDFPAAYPEEVCGEHPDFFLSDPGERDMEDIIAEAERELDERDKAHMTSLEKLGAFILRKLSHA